MDGSPFSPSERGRRFSLTEMLAWLAGISLALAIPIGLNLSLLPIVFYGMFSAISWRLSKAIPLGFAFLIAATVACVCSYLVFLAAPA